MSTVKQIEDVTTVNQLSKLVDLETLKSALKQYIRSKEYHKERNQRINRLAKLAVEHGLDK